MKKVEIKEILQSMINNFFNDYTNDNSLKQLQDLNVEYGDGHRWCSWDECLIGIIKGENRSVIYEALNIYRKYQQVSTKRDLTSVLFQIINKI